MSNELPFPRYTEFDPKVPVWCLTPELDCCIHRFFDTSPVSPSGRYVGLTRLGSEKRRPAPGDTAQIVLVDLQDGTSRIVAETSGWDTQLGAQVQWAGDDTRLCYGDLDTETWQPYAVALNPHTGEKRRVEHGIYMVSPDGTKAASPCLLRTGRTQAGYGVIAPEANVPLNEGAPDDDGVYVTDLQTGKVELLVSLRQIVETCLDPKEFEGGNFYGFHVKWNLQGTRIMLVLRCLTPEQKGRRAMVVTMSADGSDLHIAVPAREWAKGGHHPNWHPDGEHVMMNLNYPEKGSGLRFVQARFDGTDLKAMTEAAPGSGHPTLHPNERQIVTDVYQGRSLAFDDGTVPAVRLVDLETGDDRTLVRMNTRPDYSGEKNELRVDPHPAWDYAFKRIVFNGYTNGSRRAFLADLSEVVK